MSAPLVVAAPRYKSKTLAALLAFLFGSIGAHRFYLYGRRDAFGWAHLAATLIGGAGAALLIASERRSLIGWSLALPGAISLIAAFLAAIACGLRPDGKWDAQFNAASDRRNHSGWGVIFIVIFSLFIGTSALMGCLAIAFQTYFEATMGAPAN